MVSRLQMYALRNGLTNQVGSWCGRTCQSSFLAGGLILAAGWLVPPRRRFSCAEGHQQRALYRALVVGPTGATGSKVVEKLISSDAWQVTAISRRPLKGFEGTNLETVVVGDIGDFRLTGSKEYDALFVCLGTTRSSAGSAKAFVDIEVGMTEKAIAVAKAAGVRHVSVISAQGANADAWVPSEAIHPMLYIRTLGQKELAARSGGFRSVSIFRPGMLNRLTGDRMWENVINYFGLGLRVDVLAASMVIDAAQQLLQLDEEDPLMFRCDVRIFEGNALIQRMVAAD